MQSMDRASQQWELAVDSLPQFICLLDRNGRVIRANRAVERWNLGIDIADAGGRCLHDVLHRDCDNSGCYLRLFGEQVAAALVRGRRASCNVWDPVLRRHFLIQARRPILTQQGDNSQNEVFAMVTVDDVTEGKAIEKESDELTLALNDRVEHEQGKRHKAEQAHSRIIEALDNTPGFFAMADAAGALYYLNPAGRGLLGLESQEEAHGISLIECHAPAVREHLTKTAIPAAARDGSWSGDSVLLTRDGREIKTALAIIAHHGEDRQLAGFTLHERDMSKCVIAEETLPTSQTELRRLAAQNITIQESERRRIAGDLHDGLGQSLSLLKLGIQEALLQIGAGKPKKAVASVKQLLPKVVGALDELRRVCMDLRPSTLDDLGLLPTLSWFVREFESANLKTKIEKHVSVSEKDVPEPLKIVIFRILQEAINNAVKHADAKYITISLHAAGGALAFAIEDDGRGFDPGALASRSVATGGLGMQSMRERAELSGGTYAVTSAVGQGTRVCVEWPAEQAPETRQADLGPSEIANGAFAIQREHMNAGKTCNEIATAEPEVDALQPEWKQEYRALFVRLTLEETETAKRTCAVPGTDSMPACCNNEAGVRVPDREMPDRNPVCVACMQSIRSH
jgi:signal transduction histidine kinase